MRFLKWLCIVLVLLFCAGWFGASVAIRKGAEAALAKMNAGGTRIAHKDLSVSGFPTSWTVAMTEVSVADGELTWEGPALDLRATTWAPWHLTANLPASQVISVPGQTITAESAGLTATFSSAPALDLPVRGVTVKGDSLTARSDLGWTLGVDAFFAELQPDDTREAGAYVLTFDLAPLHPDPAFLAALKSVAMPEIQASDLPDVIESLYGTIGLRFTAPLALNAGSVWPELQAIEFSKVNFGWGALALHAEGLLEADAQGFAAGRIMLELTNWDRLPAVLVATGAIDPKVAPTIGTMLKAMATQSPDPSVLSLALDMKDGRMSFGPFPLGEAPRFQAPRS